ncbi:ankyrin repeat domain-containing protein [Phanerochaete sordida]|uniref:Ankyrin repeat domain-containing protein n=1 Tax=Phanerochaete sordida TaxID=48140 RepID=A0A9P3LK54_9APHY|nr:ankyrin repeat domain-containing protein [Phanerochaete sordida]
MSRPIPTEDEKDEVLLAARYGDIEDLQQFVEKFGAEPLNDIRDGSGNSVLHMVCANGHTAALDYLLGVVSPSLISAPNAAQSTPLHWAALNQQLDAARKLVECPAGPGAALIDAKNTAGRSPLGEAENVGWEEGAKWFVEVMSLEDAAKGEGEEELRPADAADQIEVEIEDAEGQVARMKIAPPAQQSKPENR